MDIKERFLNDQERQQYEDELKTTVTKTLMGSGVLSQVKAQIRASVFQVIQGADESELCANPKLNNFKKKENAMIMLSIIQDFLDTYHLDFTSSVFQPETNSLNKLIERDELRKQLAIKVGKKQSILESLLEQRSENKTQESYEEDVPADEQEEEQEEEEQQPTTPPKTPQQTLEEDDDKPPSPGAVKHEDFMNKYKDKFASPLKRNEFESDVEQMQPDLVSIEPANDTESHNVLEDTMATETTMDSTQEPTEAATEDDDVEENIEFDEEFDIGEADDMDYTFDDDDDELNDKPRVNPLLEDDNKKPVVEKKDDDFFAQDDDDLDFDMDNLGDFEEEWQTEDVSKEALDDDFLFDDDDDDDNGITSTITTADDTEDFDEQLSL